MASKNQDGPSNQIDETDLNDISSSLLRLGERLQEAAAQLKGRSMSDPGKVYSLPDGREITGADVERENARTQAAFRDTLNAMRDFRREYDRWERLTAEFALTGMSYSQREAAQELGVAASTINRWAQHPLSTEDHS